MKNIIYPIDGEVAVMSISDLERPIEEIGKKDVPAGVPFKIIDSEDLPCDWSFSGAWESDFSKPDGYGADYGVGTPLGVVGYDLSGNSRTFAHETTGEISRRSTAAVRSMPKVTHSGPGQLTINLDKAKDIAHGLRRAARSREFAPFDLKATISGEAQDAEASRQAIRVRYSDLQLQIDASKSVDELKAIILNKGL